jgi:hypothetical protein
MNQPEIGVHAISKEEMGMNCVRAARCLVLAYCLVLAGCGDSQSAGVRGAQKGTQDAERDRQAGILKLKEYPPLPYSLAEMQYIKLLKERCGVEHEVLSGPGQDQELRAETEAYNRVMTAAIQNQFGADILGKLRREAGRN